MKKIITVILSGATIFFASTGKVTAQSFGKNVATSGVHNTSSLSAFDSEGISKEKNSTGSPKESVMAAETELKASKASLKSLKASSRATENFAKMFKDVPEATWSNQEKAIVASFEKENIRTNVIYNKKGSWIHSLSYYPPAKTPANIRALVEDAYPNADITLAIEVKERGIEFFIVQLEDKRTYKKVTVYNGEINQIEELKKDH